MNTATIQQSVMVITKFNKRCRQNFLSVRFMYIFCCVRTNWLRSRCMTQFYFTVTLHSIFFLDHQAFIAIIRFTQKNSIVTICPSLNAIAIGGQIQMDKSGGIDIAYILFYSIVCSTCTEQSINLILFCCILSDFIVFFSRCV